MIDLGHGHLAGDIFTEYINLEIPDFKKAGIGDYTLPGGDPELVDILINRFNIQNIENLTLTLSTNLSFSIILNKIAIDGKKIHVPVPTFSCFYSQLNFFNGVFKLYDDFNFNQIYNEANSGDYILLVNPSNPIGVYLGKDYILDIMQKLFDKDIKLVIDLTWIFSVYSIHDHEKELNDLILNSIKYNHILLIGISKMLYSPGIRVSCVFGSSKDINYIKDKHDMLAISCSYFDQEFAKHNLFKNLIDYNSINKVLFDNSVSIINFINESSLLSVENCPKAGIFMIISSNINIDFDDMNKSTGVIVYPIAIFGGKGNSFRICITKDINIILEGLRLILNYLQKKV